MLEVCFCLCRVSWENLTSKSQSLSARCVSGSGTTLRIYATRTDCSRNSSSPLNGQAAELWDNDFEEFKRNVLARHRDLTDEDMEE